MRVCPCLNATACIWYAEWDVGWLSERWVTESEELLRRMEALSSKEKRDRLEVINSILLSLNVLERSLGGWKFWVRNLSLMAHFSLEELAEIEETLEKHVKPFIEYDIAVTERWKDKFPRVKVPNPKRRGDNETRGIYI